MLDRWMYALVGLLVPAVAAPAAHAGTYSHYACMYPNGRAGAALNDGTNGWRAVGSSIPGYSAFNECDRGGAFGVLLSRDATSHASDSYGWRYDPPVGTKVTSFEMRLAGYANPDMGEVDVSEDGVRYLYRNIRGGESGSQENSIVIGATDMTHVPNIWASCDATDCSQASGQPVARFHVYRARVDLSDTSLPTGAVTGTGVDDGTWSGTEDLDASLEDSGGGVYRVLTLVDDKLVRTTPAPSSPNCSDIAPENTNPYEFASPKPCPDRASADLDIDTRYLSEGSHTLQVIAEDAGGNRQTIYGPIVKTVRNAAPASPAPVLSPVLRLTAASVRTGRARVSVRYGDRTRFVGALRDASGTPLGGTAISVLARTAIPGAVFRQIATVATDAGGRFSYVAPPGPSRTLRFVHQHTAGNVVLSGAAEVQLRIQARVKLRASRSRLRNGHVLTFRGLVLGLRSGERKVVELRVLAGRRWMTFATTRTRRGRFSFRYRFTRTFGDVVYRFTARVRAETGFSYATGTSHVLPIRVRGR